MTILTAALLFIITFLSDIDVVVSSHTYRQESEESIINNTTTQLVNHTMIQLQSNNYYNNSQYPVQVITLPILMNDDMTMTNDNINSTQSVFRLLLPPRDFDDLCTPPSHIIDGELLQPNKTGYIYSLYPTGLLIKADTADNCTLSNIVSNVIELNRMLPESELIQYLIFTQDSNNISSMQIDTITNNNMTSELISSNNITIVYLESSYVDAIMTIIQSEELTTGCSPFILEPERNITTTCNFIYQLNEKTSNDASNGQQHSSAANSSATFQVCGEMFLAILVLIGLFVLSCCYQKYHPVAFEQMASLTIIEKEKIPAMLTKKQFNSLPKMKYTFDLIETLKKCGSNNTVTTNNNSVTNTTVLLDAEKPCKETNSASTNITPLSMEQSTKDETIVEVKDCLSTFMNDDEKKLDYISCHNMSDGVDASELQKTVQLDIRDKSTEFLDADECDLCCPTIQVNLDEECDVCCPICIEDFVVDDIVIVLPKCNHIYHKDCIKEWLMKKQGCCPYCKVVVIDVVVENAENDDNNQDSNV